MAFALLIRHGQNDWVNKNRLAGWTPGVHLNDVGRQQVERLADRLSDLPLKAIYSSPLERCTETAQALAVHRDLEIVLVDEIGEVRYGKWEGKKIKKLSKKKSWYNVQHYPSRFRFPGGESLLEVQQRAVASIESLSRRHEGEMFAVVSHADVIKLALAHYLGMHIDLFQRLVVSTASVSLVALPASGSVRVVRFNDHGPIKAPPDPKQAGHGDHTKGKSEASDDHGLVEAKEHPSEQSANAPPSSPETEEMT